MRGSKPFQRFVMVLMAIFFFLGFDFKETKPEKEPLNDRNQTRNDTKDRVEPEPEPIPIEKKEEKAQEVKPSALEAAYWQLLQGMEPDLEQQKEPQLLKKNKSSSQKVRRSPAKDTSLKQNTSPFTRGLIPQLKEEQKAPRQMGYEVFTHLPLEHTPPTRLPDPQQMMKPGDTLRVVVYGSQDHDYLLEVDQQYQLYIPQIGPLQLQGLTYQKSKERITQQLQSLYKASKVYVQFAQSSKNNVYVIGQVKRPGLVSITAPSTLLDVLMSSGGVLKSGSLRNITIKSPNETSKTVDLYALFMSGQWTPNLLKGGEVIFIPPLQHSVALVGASVQPGIYEISKGDTLDKLIRWSRGPSPEARLNIVHLYRILATGRKLITLSSEELSTEQLQANDILYIPESKGELENAFKIEGAILHPGHYQVKPNLLLKQAIQLAGGLAPKHAPVVIIKRWIDQGKEVQLSSKQQGIYYHELIELDLKSKQAESFKILDRDEIHIPHQLATLTQPKVQILGEVQTQGPQEYVEKMTLDFALTLAGGITEEANLKEITVSRLEGEYVRHIKIEPDPKNPQRPFARFIILPNDTITVPSKGQETIFVEARGEFNRPGKFMLKNGSKLSELFYTAGGMKSTAYSKGSVFHRKSVAEIYNQQLQRLADQLEQSQLRTMISNDEAALSNEARQQNSNIAMRQTRLIDKLRTTTSPGRVAINVPIDLYALSGTSHDIVLEDGDIVTIPPVPSTINILGQVNNPNTVAYEQDKTLEDYIEMAGGFTRYADEKHVFVIRANGAVIPSKYFFAERGWLDGRQKLKAQYRIEPGDTILIPEDFEIKPNRLMLTKDITQIIFQIVTSVGVAFAAF